MTLFSISALIFGLSIAAMAIGIVWGRAPLGGGCGSALDCEGCVRPCASNETQTET